MPVSATPKWPGPVSWMDAWITLPAVVESRRQSGGPLTLPFLCHCCGAQRQEPDHRADLEPHRTAVRQAKDVVIEAILLVPHAVRAYRVHRPGDQHKLQDVVRCQILVGFVVRRQLERDLEHVLAEQGHPSSASRLLQIAGGRERPAAVEDPDVVEPEKPAFDKASPKA